MTIRLKYARQRRDLAREALMASLAEARTDDSAQADERLARALWIYQAARDEVKRLEKQEGNHET